MKMCTRPDVTKKTPVHGRTRPAIRRYKSGRDQKKAGTNLDVTWGARSWSRPSGALRMYSRASSRASRCTTAEHCRLWAPLSGYESRVRRLATPPPSCRTLLTREFTTGIGAIQPIITGVGAKHGTKPREATSRVLLSLEGKTVHHRERDLSIISPTISPQP